LEGERATPSAYLSSNPERFSYLHFATHGTASRTRPLESAVVLSKEPGGDTYKLYARNIVTRHLQAELVTISACYGSGMRAYSGEGLVGLSWAFLRAGAHNVIGALWEVSDAPSTPDLMDALYRELGTGKDPASALRSAKLSLLHSANPSTVFRKPFYWAPFQLYAGS
jgi:CHAT domain-containing protein